MKSTIDDYPDRTEIEQGLTVSRLLTPALPPFEGCRWAGNEDGGGKEMVQAE